MVSPWYYYYHIHVPWYLHCTLQQRIPWYIFVSDRCIFFFFCILMLVNGCTWFRTHRHTRVTLLLPFLNLPLSLSSSVVNTHAPMKFSDTVPHTPTYFEKQKNRTQTHSLLHMYALRSVWQAEGDFSALLWGRDRVISEVVTMCSHKPSLTVSATVTMLMSFGSDAGWLVDVLRAGPLTHELVYDDVKLPWPQSPFTLKSRPSIHKCVCF